MLFFQEKELISDTLIQFPDLYIINTKIAANAIRVNHTFV